MANSFSSADPFYVDTDKTKLNLSFIHHFLSNESYWAKNIPVAVVEKSIEGSLCFGVYENGDQAMRAGRQVGFARVVTDFATFGYLADVFIDPTYRGKGLGKMLMHAIMHHPQLQGFRRWMLATRDAHSLYAPFGFTALDKPERIMRYAPFDSY